MVGLTSIAISGVKGTKAQIIHALCEEWPLTAKQVHNALKRRHSSASSYQAVHKAAKQLIEEGVLQKVDGKLQISYGWVRELSRRLESSFREKTGNSEISTLKFNSLVEYGKFLIDSFLCYPNPENKDCVCSWNHAYPITGVSQEEHETMKLIFGKTTHYSICANRTFLDNMTQEYLSKIGKRAFTGKLSSKLDTFVTGDYVLQAFLPAEFEKELDELYAKTKSEKDLDMQKLFEFACKNYEITAVISKNQKLADKLRAEAKELFVGQKVVRK